MNKIFFLLLVVSLFLGACTSTKEAFSSNSKSIIKPKNVVDNALNYLGTKYRYGGTSDKGMDCSGLVTTAFKEQNIIIPRSSRDIAVAGKEVALKNAKKGDLVFFVTRNRKKVIDHVGLITSVKNGEVQFIHSTTTRGVIISSMYENNWKNTFAKAVTFF
ncbi:MAG: C40 family peptidase [Flavobacteriia bacterium]|nr:C40 family peptidase [Flavobacteriia bacterium]OIP48557.1 MAG: glycoside hydrolase [Flavobacteriaceae bacterium CG2_30_31_66]PIV97073.1 MAG: NlpC/P60 family protein [Flavobacteriaceae bacterium CG17_big_fil_post_rev_8_21_14_2_50_31_13]PIX13856.1 MAG: NlpC/P60 family protein [Flavobacteriaceae bacterium CG_4_8_14_3_um_filter_31_8]PIY13698.1 MAG: NlpC/P60 family protein [Flavobacteriaceae bacterium CG_4_10_14_3_um_filter_31_253]PIZ10808.1 MAG: NlpC/P60 family protein [Flavobacteriaceae bacter